MKQKKVMNQSEFPGIPLDEKQTSKMPGNGQPETMTNPLQPKPPMPKRNVRHKVKMNPMNFK